jgi:hypothetical protein
MPLHTLETLHWSHAHKKEGNESGNYSDGREPQDHSQERKGRREEGTSGKSEPCDAKEEILWKGTVRGGAGQGALGMGWVSLGPLGGSRARVGR